ncbi:His/Gly/Thr/Pro-type tRNA ligase C-terminal domain-containing protein [Niabella ginsengisoli]|uniref:His/Gly/Thr/Pro-type tRNA ligase C-terminal domain-containing protein n=1 Tax=Niabella ginsengisoli TaxID=522298 RepID=A0ABS9SQ58_9BACT|nr:His/Gly/Thr/Pro-type tRNA ligase C-terminal domain-containing protein [Niabella ginsengisoli]MCH5600539.1 His/Gly/Thr/Pro-type tRNA ligase C-terminal domain-containing protein [Niabella ginsengisoli]
MPNIPGVGISFGVDRIYDVMSELDLFPKEVAAGTKLLFFNLGEAEAAKALELAGELRSNNIACEVYHENSKFDKQFKYAEKKAIPYVAILGSKELEQGVVNIKNLGTGEQEQVSFLNLVKPGFKGL